MKNPAENFSCPWFRDCIGNGNKFNCTYAVAATKKNGRKEFKKKPACFKTFRRKATA